MKIEFRWCGKKYVSQDGERFYCEYAKSGGNIAAWGKYLTSRAAHVCLRTCKDKQNKELVYWMNFHFRLFCPGVDLVTILPHVSKLTVTGTGVDLVVKKGTV